MCPPPEKVKTKGAPKGWPTGSSKRQNYRHEERSAKCSTSLFEHAESHNPDIHISQSSYARRKSSRKSTGQSPHSAPVASLTRTWPNLEEWSLFMHTHLENVIDVAVDEHCRLCSVSGLIRESIDTKNMVCLDLSVEPKNKER
jgi:hypothetical protein